jgi:hypothetical protein
MPGDTPQAQCYKDACENAVCIAEDQYGRVEGKSRKIEEARVHSLKAATAIE